MSDRLRTMFGRSGEPAAPRVITVLGMHRSGTSALTGSLEAAGLPLGDVRTEGGKSNVKGHREPGELISLHEDVLITSGGAWHLPPPSVTWTTSQRKRRDDFIAAHSGLPLWGWKEPRTLLVIDAWLEAIPTLAMVGTFRHPAVVARSLQRRHGSDTADMWLGVWLAYDRALLELVEARGFPVIDFDLPSKAYRARLRAIVDELALPHPERAETFFEADLRRSRGQVPPDVDLPVDVASVHERLREIAAAQAAG